MCDVLGSVTKTRRLPILLGFFQARDDDPSWRMMPSPSEQGRDASFDHFHLRPSGVSSLGEQGAERQGSSALPGTHSMTRDGALSWQTLRTLTTARLPNSASRLLLGLYGKKP